MEAKCEAIAVLLETNKLFPKVHNELFHDCGPIDNIDEQDISMEMDRGMSTGIHKGEAHVDECTSAGASRL